MSWLSHLWFGYGWSSDKGNAGENLQWTALAILVASLLIPRVRKFIERHVKGLHDKLDHHHEMILQQNEAHHEEALQLARDHHEAHLAAIKPQAKRDARGRFT